MDLTLSRRMTQLQPSPTLALNAKAKELAEQGHKVINFSVGEPDFPTPAPIVEAGIKALREGKTKYGGAGGGVPLRKLIAEKLKRENQLTYDLNQIVVGVGAKEILFHISLSILNEGDEVLIPAPYWVSYTEHVLAAGAKPVVIPMPEDHRAPRLTPDMIKPYVTARTKAIMITSPNNPAGYVIPPAELEALGRYLEDKPWYIISDEIYEQMSFDGPSVSMATLVPGIRDRFILVNGFSKGYAMTGWRVGYMAGPLPVANMVRTLQTQSSTCLPMFVEDAACEAYRLGPQCMQENMKELRRLRDLAFDILSSIPDVSMLKPSGAFYVFLDLRKVLARTGLNSLDFSKKLLETYHVAMVPGEAFGVPGFVRLSYAVREDILREGLKRLSDALSALRNG